MKWMMMLVAGLAGFLLPFQAGANARMGQAAGVGHATPAMLFGAMMNFLVGGVALGAVALALGTPLPTPGRVQSVPWWAWTAGLIGAVFVGMTVFVVPRVGVGLMLASVVVGQMIGSLIVDKYGLVGLPAQPVGLGKVLGVGLLIAGVVLIKGR